jgi:hypothetical protein
MRNFKCPEKRQLYKSVVFSSVYVAFAFPGNSVTGSSEKANKIKKLALKSCTTKLDKSEACELSTDNTQ